MPTISNIIQIAKVSAYLAAPDVSNGAAFGGRLDRKLAQKIAMARRSVEFMYGQNTGYATLVATANYLYGLCGKYAIQAQVILNMGGGGTVTPSFPSKAKDYTNYIRVTSPDFLNTTDYKNPDLQGQTFRLEANWLNKYLDYGTEWTYLAGGGFKILLPGFDSTVTGIEIYVDLKGEAAIAASSGYEYSLSVDNYIVPNLAVADRYSYVTIVIIPNGHTYDWDTNFIFTDTWPKQPDATAANTQSIYTFQFVPTSGKWFCVNQSINAAYP